MMQLFETLLLFSMYLKLIKQTCYMLHGLCTHECICACVYACIDRRIKMVRGVFRLRKKTNKNTV